MQKRDKHVTPSPLNIATDRRTFLLAGSSFGLAALGLLASPTGLIAATEAPKKGGVLKMGRVADVVTFDPVFQTDNMSIWAKLLVFQLLVRSDQEGKGVVPDLAESWDVSPDKRKYTFHLRKDAKFSDGTPVRASDVKFTVERVVTADGSWAAPMFPKMTISAVDDNTVAFELEQDWAPFLEALSVHAAAIVPEAYFNKVGDKAFGDKPIGSGPFMIDEWSKGNRIVLKPNPGFWDPTRPYLDEVQLLVLPDDNVRMLKVQSGEIDVGTDVPFNQVDKLSHLPGLKVELDPLFRIDWVQFNEKSDKFKDKKVRQAINWAVDKQGIINAVLFGGGEVPTSFLPKMLWTDLKSAPYGYDVEKAKSLMAESAQPNGFSATLSVVSGDTIGRQVAEIVKEQLKEIAIDVNIVELEGATQYNQLASGEYEMAEGYMTSDVVDPSELVAYAGAGDEGSDAVWTFYNNADVNKLAADALTELDRDKREALYIKLQQMVLEDAPFLWLYWISSRTAVSDKVNGFKVLPTGNYWLEDVWKA
jgi:peptide/nickel transport system substrate-binding protein